MVTKAFTNEKTNKPPPKSQEINQKFSKQPTTRKKESRVVFGLRESTTERKGTLIWRTRDRKKVSRWKDAVAFAATYQGVRLYCCVFAGGGGEPTISE